ncbi:iron ABC transporter ATP-binding protein [Agromyces neolithicus]|uniref:Iron ABC transporter ATP-binding protein n=1 Tax=Agromyces neolithicus TaxID=269420 RepID=A0ABN2LYE0_9MICO
MPRPLHPARTPVFGPVLVAAASVLLLTGCSGAMPGGATDPGAPPAASESPAATASQPAEPDEKPVPFEVACDELLSADDVYAFNPNYGTDPGFEPSAEALVGVVDEAGTACGLLNQTNGAVIEFGVATPPAGALATRMGDAALNSNVVPTYGTPPDVEGYFSRAGDVGEAQVFTGRYWVVIDSTELVEPGDAQSLVSALLANLPAG